MEEMDAGLAAMIDKYGVDKVTTAFARMAQNK